MSAIATPNSVQSQLNQDPLVLPTTQGISDPIIRQSFESINKIISQRFAGKQIEKANIVFGAAFGVGSGLANLLTGTTLITPGALQLQIATRGNPVRVKLGPFQYAQGAPASFTISASAPNDFVTGTFGWYRTNAAGGTKQTLCQITTGLSAKAAGALPAQSLSIPLPAFEFDDVVPSGTYTYQFFILLGSATTTLYVSNLQAVAYELR